MKISYKKVTILLLILTLMISGVIWTVVKISKKNLGEENVQILEKKIYEVLITVRDQKNAEPEADKKNSMKKGYVIGVYDEGHSWSQTEKISYLIIKMELNEEQKTKLVQAIEKDSGEDLGKEIIGIREYKINLDKVGFNNPNILLDKQPFEDKVFNWEVVEKIEN